MEVLKHRHPAGSGVVADLRSHIKRFASKVYTTLASRRMGVVSMLLLVVLFAIGLLVPQWGEYTDAEFAQLIERHGVWLRIAGKLGLTDIYRSWPMIIVFVLFCANLWLSFANRLQVIRHEINPARAKMAGRHQPERATIATDEPQSKLDELAKLLRKKGFKVVETAKGITGVRNRFSVGGSVLFHLSFYLLIAALALRMLTFFQGTAIVGEGQRFGGHPWSYAAAEPKRMSFDELPQVAFTLERILVRYDERDNLLDAAAIIVPHGTGEEFHTIRVNYPYRFEDSAVRLVEYGLAPIITIRETDKRLEHKAGVRLMAFPPGREDSFRFPNLDTEFRIMFFPSYDEEAGLEGSRFREVTNPRAIIAFTDKNGTPQEVELVRGKWAQASNLLLKFDDIRYWGRFEVNRDLGRVPLYIGLLLAFVGLVWRMFVLRSRVDATVQEKDGGKQLKLTGKADYTRQPFAAEFESIVEQLDPGSRDPKA